MQPLHLHPFYSLTATRDTFYNLFISSALKSWKLFCTKIDFNHSFRWQFCTSVMACAKLRSDEFILFYMLEQSIFYNIWIMSTQTVCETVPGSRWSKFLTPITFNLCFPWGGLSPSSGLELGAVYKRSRQGVGLLPSICLLLVLCKETAKESSSVWCCVLQGDRLCA